jgi:hypothetical protein
MPEDDIRGLGNNILDRDTANQFLADILSTKSEYLVNYQSNQSRIRKVLSIHDSKLRNHQQINVIELNDFFAETNLIYDMMINQIIDKQSIILGLDTVGKIFWAGPNPGDKRVINNLNYDIQRITGSVNPNWIRLLYPTPYGNNPDYETINQVLSNSINHNTCTDYLFYPEYSDPERQGALFFKQPTQGAPCQVLRLELNKNMEENRKQQVILAIAQGIFFGLRQRIEQIWKHPDELIHKPIICYGGLGSNNQNAWNELFADIFVDISSDIKRLELPSVNIAAAYSGIKQIGGNPKIPNINIRQLATVTDVNSEKTWIRQKEYAKWLYLKPQN